MKKLYNRVGLQFLKWAGWNVSPDIIKAVVVPIELSVVIPELDQMADDERTAYYKSAIDALINKAVPYIQVKDCKLPDKKATKLTLYVCVLK